MKISSLWVVTRATPLSTIYDICFRVELPLELYNQFKGGLTPADIVAFYDDENSAKEKARLELHRARAAQRT